MERIERHAFIEAPPAKVFGYLMDPTHFPEFWPSMVEVANVKTRPDGTTQSNDWTYKMGGVKFHGHTEFVEVQPDRLIVLKGEGGIKNTIRWSFAPSGNGTEFVDEVEYELPANLLTWLAAPLIRKLNEREADTVIHNLKDRMETAEPAA
jgi:uncharacterized protein YndB with AHSA1/START domain